MYDLTIQHFKKEYSVLRGEGLVPEIVFWSRQKEIAWQTQVDLNLSLIRIREGWGLYDG